MRPKQFEECQLENVLPKRIESWGFQKWRKKIEEKKNSGMFICSMVRCFKSERREF